VPVLYYIAPQMWAWAPGRVRRLAAVRRLAVILPFEEAFFRARGVAATFVGHPLLDRPPAPSLAEARGALGLEPDVPVLGVFPGSRRQEVLRMWEPFRDAALLVRERRPVQIVVAGRPWCEYPDPGTVRVYTGDPQLVFAASDAALCKAGTTTLEAALADVPMVIAYRLHPASYAIGRRVLAVRQVGLVNLIAERVVAPEFLQDTGTPVTLANAVAPLLDRDGAAAQHQREGLAMVRARLGGPGAADRVAAIAAELVA
jgi:lipid-A-disaccharide synthase